MRVILAVTVVAVAACGRVAFDPVGGGEVSDAGPCLEPWGTSAPIASIAGTGEPAVSDDELELFTVSGGSLFVQSRSTATGPWGAAQAVVLPPSNDPYLEAEPSLSGDGLVLYFTSTRMSNAFVMRTRRASRSAAWGAEADTMVRGRVDVRRDELEIFSQEFIGPIQHAERTSVTGSFGPLSDLSMIINDGNARSPSISGDGLELYFTRVGQPDIYVAHRASLGAPFTAVQSTGLNGTAPEICADGRHLYFVDTDKGIAVSSRCE